MNLRSRASTTVVVLTVAFSQLCAVHASLGDTTLPLPAAAAVTTTTTPDVPSLTAVTPVTSASEEEQEEWRELLPPSLQNRRTLHRFFLPADHHGSAAGERCEIYLLGTSHISASSCDDVRLLMDHVLPDCLFIELCPQRMAILEDTPKSLQVPPPSTIPVNSTTTQKRWFRRRSEPTAKKTPLLEQIRAVQAETGMTRSSALSAVLLTKIQGDYADQLGITVGAEFKEAYQTSLRLPQQPRIILGDRPVRLTLLRAWESLSVLSKLKLIVGLLWSTIRQPSAEELKAWMESIMNDGGEDVLSKSIKELSKHFPTIERVIIRERDAYMYAKLCQVAQLGARRVVAVVGAGHCPGICEHVTRGQHNIQPQEQGNRTATMLKSPEEMLRDIVQTRRYRLDGDNELETLVSDVVELQTKVNTYYSPPIPTVTIEY